MTATEVQPATDRPTDAAPAATRTVSVLMVVYKDSEAASVLLALRRAGLSVRPLRIADAGALRQALDESTWDMVITESRMPAWGGLDVLRLVQAHSPRLPVILVYGEGGDSAGIEAIRSGASDCIHKTEVPHRLAASVQRTLDDARQHAERRQGDRRLQLNAASSLSMFDNHPVACMLNIPGAAITMVNRRFVALSGYAKDDLLGRRVEDLALWGGDTKSRQTAKTIQDSAHADGLQGQFRRRDGCLRQVMVSTTMVHVDGVDQLLHSFVDITEQRLATEAAHLARKALAAASLGVLICGADRRILSANQAFVTMTGFAEEDLIGSTCALLQGPDTNPQTILAMRSAMDRKQSFDGEILNYRKNGSSFWNQLTIDPVHDERGELTHFVGILRDVTAQRAPPRGEHSLEVCCARP